VGAIGASSSDEARRRSPEFACDLPFFCLSVSGRNLRLRRLRHPVGLEISPARSDFANGWIIAGGLFDALRFVHWVRAGAAGAWECRR
jgi:hypothetical protein